jgi:hypothetical protein
MTEITNANTLASGANAGATTTDASCGTPGSGTSPAEIVPPEVMLTTETLTETCVSAFVRWIRPSAL